LKAEPHVSVDFEAFHSKEVSIKMGAWKYLHHPLVLPNIFLVGIFDGEQEFIGHPRDFDWRSIADQLWVSHNRSFDRMVYEVLLRESLIEGEVHDDWDCTADLAAYLHSRRNLKDAAKFLLEPFGIEKQLLKDIRKHVKGKLPEEMKQWILAENDKLYNILDFPCGTPTLWDEIQRMCISDSRVSWQLWQERSNEWPTHERRASRLTTRQAFRGLQINASGATGDLIELNRACDYARQHLPWANALSTDAGVLAPTALNETIRASGLIPPSSIAEDSEICRAWERAHPKCQLIKFMRDFRKLNIQRRRYEHVLQRLMSNNRFPFSWRYAGTHITLRWAGGSSFAKGGTGETGFNVQNMSKDPIYLGNFGEVLDIGPDDGKIYEVDFRKRVIATKGRKLIIADAKQIEARITKWLAATMFNRSADWEDLKRIAEGMSIYEVHARRTMGWAGGDIKREDPDRQFVAKTRVLALGFQCGWKRYGEQCKTLGHPIPAPVAKAEVRDFRAKEIGIVRLWTHYQNLAEEAATKGDVVIKANPGVKIKELWDRIEPFVIPLPSGRDEIFYAPHHPTREELDKQNPLWTDITRRKKVKRPLEQRDILILTELGGTFTHIFGGKILENIVQGIARDILLLLMLKLEDRGLKTLFTSHDETISEAELDIEPKEIEKLLNLKLDWAKGLPIAVDVIDSAHYLKA
jgi:DNA polymerase